MFSSFLYRMSNGSGCKNHSRSNNISIGDDHYIQNSISGSPGRGGDHAGREGGGRGVGGGGGRGRRKGQGGAGGEEVSVVQLSPDGPTLGGTVDEVGDGFDPRPHPTGHLQPIRANVDDQYSSFVEWVSRRSDIQIHNIT